MFALFCLHVSDGSSEYFDTLNFCNLFVKFCLVLRQILASSEPQFLQNDKNTLVFEVKKKIDENFVLFLGILNALIFLPMV